VFTVVSPTTTEKTAAVEAWKAGRGGYDYNRAATALWITWRGRTVLLGSDLVEKPGKGWTSAMAHGRLNEHDVYKIAHHGAKKALGPQNAPPPRTRLRTWLGTPFANKGLPKPGEGDALCQMLAIEDEIHFTALPAPYEDQAAEPRDIRRSQL